MKIGLVAPPWLPVPPLQYGGTESVVDRLARGLVDQGHEVLLAAPSDRSCPVPRVPGLPAADPARMGQTVVELAYVLTAYAALGTAWTSSMTTRQSGRYAPELHATFRSSPPTTALLTRTSNRSTPR